MRRSSVGPPDLVELVDEGGAPVGAMPKLAAHAEPGTLHRAFSVFLGDEVGRVILQRRALTKYHTPGLWSNSCCGHPAPGEDPLEAATRRLREELGIALRPTALASVATVTYEVVDDATGLVEHEFDHVFVGVAEGALRPDTAEVAEVRSLPLDELGGLETTGLLVTPWFATVLAAARPALEELADVSGSSGPVNHPRRRRGLIARPDRPRPSGAP
ncbi:MAG TPA: isopentenyl-diphosphate Delta-isomerase [Candidatus Dormibacteraeota bacterium]|nr:isopentenyl-diphosphate Delta-isomerase [Candidatus Dormibacteraeota bacterium]